MKELDLYEFQKLLVIDGINQIETKFFCTINADVSMDPKDISKMLELSKDFSFLGKLLFRLNISDILYTYVAAYTWNTYRYNHKETRINLWKFYNNYLKKY